VDASREVEEVRREVMSIIWQEYVRRGTDWKTPPRPSTTRK
jgi:hypothetical protein